MASEGADPKAPQAEVVTTSGTNNTARVGPYTDPGLTKRNVSGSAAASDLPPPKSIGNSQGDIRPVYANDQDAEIENTAAASENAGVTPPPKSPNSWVGKTVDGIFRSRDPYTNDGMTGQDFYKNQGSGG